jgi:GH35 family endo-1,4-beta-xylanase
MAILRRMAWGLVCASALAAMLATNRLYAQSTSLNAGTLAFRSNGSSSGAGWRLDDNGYVGSYITLAAPGTVTIRVNATGANGGGANPAMNIVVGDVKAPFAVGSSATNYQHTFSLPAGTHFVRTEYINDFVSNAIPASTRNITVQSMTVTGATVSNANSEANALAAADTYIANGRRGQANLTLVGATPGSSVQVKLKRHEFNWGANVHGTSTSLFSNTQYTNFFKTHFNMVSPSRAGKWNNQESTRDVVTSVTSGYLDTMLDFAEANDMRARMHMLIWANDDGAEQPAWARNMLNNPTAIDPVSGKNNLDALRDEISERIDYYIGDGPGGRPELAQRYHEIDIYNESVHTGVDRPTQPNYWYSYGAEGISDIYEESGAAAAAAGSTAKTYVNEYNVFNWGDSYANWYRQHIETIENADGDPTDKSVGGIGIQAYQGLGGGAVQPTRMQQAMQNLSTLGLPMTLSEFGVHADVTDPLQAKDQVNKIMRMVFGHPDMETFMYWGFWPPGSSAPHAASALVNADWSLTDIGKMYEDMLGIQDWDGNTANGWTTNVTLPVAADGTIDFTGFYGLFDVMIGGKTYNLDLTKGTTDYQLVINLAADFDNDGTVDADDLGVWQAQQALGGSGGDADGDMDTDGDDFLIWQRQLGLSETVPVAIDPVSMQVPEPTAAALAALALATLVRRRR